MQCNLPPFNSLGLLLGGKTVRKSPKRHLVGFKLIYSSLEVTKVTKVNIKIFSS